MLGAQNAVIELQAKARQVIEKARQLEKNGNFQEAGTRLRTASEIIRKIAERETVQADRVRRYQKAKQAEDMALKLEKGQRVFTQAKEAPDSSLPAENEYRATVDELIYRSPVEWEDIAGMDEVKKSLKYALGLMLAKMPPGVRLNTSSRILLYGPPGTGKTLLAAACSNMLGATFFNVKASNLLSKWFGESTRLISALFARARSEADTGVSVVFIDELDGLCHTRGASSESGAERRILSTLLAELDGLAEKGEASRVITIAATNKPWDIDEAILERFKRHIYVDLPEQESREAIFKIHIQRAGLELEGLSYADLAKRAKGYSGRLIERVCQQAVDHMVAEANPAVPGQVDGNTIQDYELQVRPMGQKDFDRAFALVRPSVNQQQLNQLTKFQAHVGGEHV